MEGTTGSRRRRWRVSTAARVFILCAVGLIAIATWRIALATEPLRWPTVSGKILESARSKEFVGIHIGRNDNSPMWEDRFHIKYLYDVRNHSYVGTRIDDLAREGRKYTLTGDRRYPVGSAVVVHYDPREPSRSVLEINAPFGAVLTILVAIAIIVLALMPGHHHARWRRAATAPFARYISRGTRRA